MAKKWTEEDIEFLKWNYETLSYEEIGDALGRSYESVRSKANKLKFPRKNGWTEDETRYLKENYSRTSIKEISYTLKKSEASVGAKAFSMGITKIPDWTDKQISFLREKWETTTAKKIGELLGRTESSVYNKARDLGLDSKNLKLEGKKFGRLTVINKTEQRKNKKAIWYCQCDCGSEVYVRSSDLTTGQQISCGCLRNEKASKRLTQNLIGRKFTWLTVIKKADTKISSNIVWECKCNCGNITYVQTKLLNNGNTKSCGCYNIWKSTGKNHHRYNHKLTNEERLRNRDLRENVVFRKSVFERDNYTCTICGQRNGNHVAHHLNGWNKFPEERFLTDNGVTLCEVCHKKFHSQFGYGNNTKEQFEEYTKTLV